MQTLTDHLSPVPVVVKAKLLLSTLPVHERIRIKTAEIPVRTQTWEVAYGTGDENYSSSHF